MHNWIACCWPQGNAALLNFHWASYSLWLVTVAQYSCPLDVSQLGVICCGLEQFCCYTVLTITYYSASAGTPSWDTFTACVLFVPHQEWRGPCCMDNMATCSVNSVIWTFNSCNCVIIHCCNVQWLRETYSHNATVWRTILCNLIPILIPSLILVVHQLEWGEVWALSACCLICLTDFREVAI